MARQPGLPPDRVAAVAAPNQTLSRTVWDRRQRGISAYGGPPAPAHPDQLHNPGYGRSGTREAAMDFQPADDSFNLHRPLASFPNFISPGSNQPRWRAKTHSEQEHSEDFWSVSHHFENANTHHWPFSAAPAYPTAPRGRKGRH